MTEKINQYKYYILTLVTMSILSSIGFYAYNKNRENIVHEDEVQFNFTIDGRNYIMPSPFHSFHFLNTMNFQWKYLADYNSTSDYKNESQTALNMGYRAADGIVMLFAGEKENARKTRTVVIELADKLDITPDIREAISALDNAAIIQADPTVLDARIIHLQFQMEKALHKKKKDNLAVLVELGGWLEGLHISSKGIIKNYDPLLAEILRQPHIAEIYIDVLSVLSKRATNEKEKKLLESVLLHLIKLQKISNHTHKESFPLVKVRELYDVSSEVKKLIESTGDKEQK